MKKKFFEKTKKAFVTEVLANKAFYFIVLLVLLCATFLRTYRTDKVLQFFFDQGRDAMVVSELLHNGKFFLIGPTTGIAGIFRGPFYYYLITPLYFIGNGNPVYPAVFLALMCVGALALMYYLAKEAGGRSAGLFAIIVGSFSYYIMYASRWLSNPTPMLLLSLLLVWMMLLIKRGHQWAWVALAFISGSSLFHFGSSGEFFYFPAIFIFFLWQIKLFSKKRNIPSVPVIVISILAFAATAAPLVLFDLRHENILSKNIAKFFVGDGSFKASFWEVAQSRLDFLANVFYVKVFHSKDLLSVSAMLLVIGAGLLQIRTLLRNDVVKICLLLLASPWIGLLFFQGNEGNIYDYYLTGYYLIFLLLIGVCLSSAWKSLIGKIVVVVFLLLFLKQNLPSALSFISDGVDGPTTIAFGNQKQALDWIYEDAQGQSFNIDEYVPPVIPHAYDYLERWYSLNLGKIGHVEEQVPLLYTIYEEDPPHPERLSAWLKRQEGIGTVLSEQKFGGITVQRRTRI